MEFTIRNEKQAREIIKAFNECSTCSECKLNNAEGWRCSYLKEQAEEYLIRSLKKNT